MKSLVPTPRPLAPDIEIHAFYYPGTEQMPEWDQIAQTRPEIKPLLGWYDEGDPDVVDWQINWAVEHGISAFCVDWYWNRGDRRLEHWVGAFQRARHRRFLKWYAMYANHNQPGAIDEADLRRTAAYWIENGFKTDEYYKIDGKPVVVFWSAVGLDDDIRRDAATRGEALAPGEGARRAIAILDECAKAAGLPGVSVRAMWTDDASPAFARKAGFDALTLYNFDNRALRYATPVLDPRENPSAYSFETMCAGIREWWRRNCRGDDEVPTLPTIPTGWNDMPRSFDAARLVYGLTPEKFGALCRECRAFCEERGIRQIYLAPINEWQEGSYAEPNEEFGFALYDAVRDAFCRKPPEGWPQNLRPADVGYGPYDYPPMPRLARTFWDFSDGTPQGWYRHPYGCAYVRVRDGALWFFRSWGADRAAIRTRIAPFDATACPRFVLRMKVSPSKFAPLPTGSERVRLWWGTEESPLIVSGEKRSVPGDVPILCVTKANTASTPVLPDGKWHDYEIDLSDHPHWKDAVNEVWFDPGECFNADVSIAHLGFSPKPSK